VIGFARLNSNGTPHARRVRGVFFRKRRPLERACEHAEQLHPIRVALALRWGAAWRGICLFFATSSLTGIALSQSPPATCGAIDPRGSNAPSRISLFRQPEIGSHEVDSCMIGAVEPQSERFLVRLGNYGPAAPLVLQAWDAGRFTRLSVPAGCQRGLLSEPDATAVQVHGREIGIWIDSDHPRPALGALLPITPAYWWQEISRPPLPFHIPNSEPDREQLRELAIAFDLKVPTANREGAAEVYVTTNFLFRDTRSKQGIWLAATLFDPRGEARFPDTVHMDSWEAGTQLPILFSALNTKSRWLHPGPRSSLFTDQPSPTTARLKFA